MTLDYLTLPVLKQETAALILENHFGFRRERPGSEILVCNQLRIALINGKDSGQLVFKFGDRKQAFEKLQLIKDAIYNPTENRSTLDNFPKQKKMQYDGEFCFQLICGLRFRFVWGNM